MIDFMNGKNMFTLAMAADHAQRSADGRAVLCSLESGGEILNLTITAERKPKPKNGPEPTIIYRDELEQIEERFPDLATLNGLFDGPVRGLSTHRMLEDGEIPVGEKRITKMRQRVIVATKHYHPKGKRRGQVAFYFEDEGPGIPGGSNFERRMSYRNWCKYKKVK